MSLGPAQFGRRIGGLQLATQFPHMLAGMPQIDNLNGSWKMLLGNGPVVMLAVGQNHPMDGATPASTIGFGVERPAELFGSLDPAQVSGRSFVADRVAL